MRRDRIQAGEIASLEQKLAYRNRWISVYFDLVRFPDGKLGRYTRVVERSPGQGVAILPLTKGRELGLLHIYRYPVHSWHWEIPRGLSEEGGSQKENALRELEEETGLKPKGLVHLGRVFPNTGILATHVDVFLAHVQEFSRVRLRPGKEGIMELRFFPFRQVYGMVKDGQIMDGITLASLMLAHSTGHLGPPSRRPRRGDA